MISKRIIVAKTPCAIFYTIKYENQVLRDGICLYGLEDAQAI